jgi:predicted DNA-binding transcriptional regulator AlpA
VSEELLTAQEAAALMKISLSAFYAWRRRHQVPSRVEGRSLRFYARDLVKDAVKAAPPVMDFAALGRQHARAMAREATR